MIKHDLALAENDNMCVSNFDNLLSLPAIQT